MGISGKSWIYKHASAKEKQEVKAWFRKRRKAKKKKQKKQKNSSKKKSKTLTYSEQLNTPQWKAKRKHILDTKGYICACCGSRFDLQIHHLRYIPGHLAWEYDDEDLVVLCKNCHEKIHGLR